VRGVLHQHRALRLWIPGHAGAAAGAAEFLDVAGLAGQLEVAPVNGHQTQPGVEGLRINVHIGQLDTAALHQITQWGRTDLAAHAADG